MNNDRELLELAAKAAGYNQKTEPAHWLNWNPLTDDGDALRLAVKLKLWVFVRDGYTDVMGSGDEFCMTSNNNDDPYAATRRSIVRAAAEIGKGKK
jgi:hypothetical protein